MSKLKSFKSGTTLKISLSAIALTVGIGFGLAGNAGIAKAETGEGGVVNSVASGTAVRVIGGETPDARLAVDEADNVSNGAVPTEDEISALRYYAIHRDENFTLEMQRLQRIYPAWIPPSEFELRQHREAGFDETPLWDLFNQGKYDEVEAEIARLQAHSPNFMVSHELRNELQLVEDREHFANAAAAGQHQTVIRIAESNPQAFQACIYMDNLWSLGEAYYKTNDPANGYAVYEFIITECDNSAERLATLQKANEIAPATDVDRLFALEAQNELSVGEREALEMAQRDLRRGDIARVLGEGDLNALSQAEVDFFKSDTISNEDASDAAILGWYYYRRGSFNSASTWFNRSMNWGDSDTAAEGVVLSAIGQGRNNEAEDIAFNWKHRSAVIHSAYQDLMITRLGIAPPNVVPTANIERFAEHSVGHKDKAAANALGWYYYQRNEFTAAARWFETSLSWGETRKGVEGLAYSYLQLGEMAKFDAMREQYGSNSNYAEIFDLGAPTGSGGNMAATEAYLDGDYEACLNLTADLQSGDANVAAVALQRGWCLLALERPTEAEAMFIEASLYPDAPYVNPDDAIFGRVLSLLRRGRIDDATLLIEESGIAPERRSELQGEALAQRAILTFENGDYEMALRLIGARSMIMPVRRDLLEISAWSLWELGRKGEAEDIFYMLDEQMSTASTQEGLRLTGEDYHFYR